MGVTAVSTVGNNTLGNYLKIVSQNGVYGQLSENAAVWRNILKRKKAMAEGRERRFLLRSTNGVAAAQFVAVNGAVAYPAAQQASISEGVAYYKDFALTIEVERTLIAKAINDMSRYGEPLAEEMKCKTIGMARMLSSAVYQDGTGVIGTVSSASVVSSRLSVVLDATNSARGHVGWFDYGDILKCVTTAGAVQWPTVSSGTISYLQVEAIDRVNDTVTLSARNSAGTELTVSATNNVSSGKFFLRGIPATDSASGAQTASGITPQDIASVTSSSEYGTLSEAFVGFDSLLQDDNRKVFGINLTGAIKATRKSAGGNPLDSSHFQEGLSLVKVAVGDGTYKWSEALMAPESLDSLIESRETDRRFDSVTDQFRGVTGMGYKHGKDTVLFTADEFCPKKRIYVLPDSSDVLQFYGSDFEFVQPDGGQKFFLRPTSSGGHYRSVRAYMEGSGLILCVHPQSCLVIHNFTV